MDDTPGKYEIRMQLLLHPVFVDAPSVQIEINHFQHIVIDGVLFYQVKIFIKTIFKHICIG